MDFENTLSFAESLDEKDLLRSFRNQFLFPKQQQNECIYFTGNSLGLQPKSTVSFFMQELEDWAKFGVEGHFEAHNPWVSYHEPFANPLAKIVGAKPSEVVAMNTLTANLHFLLVSFYNPSNDKFKILCEEKPFPSDYFALESQVKFHGFDPKEAIIEVKAQKNGIIDDALICATIEEHKNELALIMLGGVNYYTGQRFDMEKIASTASKNNITVGYDLAHATGNVELQLHNWNVDFAAWCSYKYLNSGPGGVGGIFVHEKHHNRDLPRFNGWWGHDKESRFKMGKKFVPIPTAEAWQTSNAQVFNMVAHKASLEIFSKAGMDNIFKKRDVLTAYTEYVIHKSIPEGICTILTPKDPHKRGCQLSLFFKKEGRNLFNYLTENGVIADWREPNVIRIAPVPLYNSFEDSFRFGQLLHTFFEQKA